MAITRDEIIQAAEAIEERGESPTLAAVRRELGGGSFTTISEVMQVWRAERQAAQARAEVVQVPEVVRDAMSKAAITVWTEAVQLHGAQLAAERKALEQERIRVETERREATEVADQISRDLERERERAEKVAAALEAERQAHTTTRTALAEAQAQAGERAVRIEALEAEVTTLRKETAKAEAERDALGRERDQAKAETGEAMERERQARDEAAELRGRLAAALESSQGQAEAPAKPTRARRTRTTKTAPNREK